MIGLENILRLLLKVAALNKIIFEVVFEASHKDFFGKIPVKIGLGICKFVKLSKKSNCAMLL